MPKIGMRNLKSAIAVFICFLIYLIRGDGIPFYSAIAAILCMQPYVSNSVKVAKNRTIGTFIGGFCGMIVLIIEKHFIPKSMPMLQYLLISASIVVVIYITILVKKTTASYISCVVFLSVTVSHGLDVSPYAFALNRILDTLIGIAVSLCVNMFHLPKRKNATMLFVSNLDGTLLNSKGEISTYSKVKLNQMLKKDALITVSTARTSVTVLPILEGVDFKLPIITMNGAALYDLKEKSYLYCKTIEYDTSKNILSVFDKYGLNCFTHTIVNDILHIYYGDFTNPAEKKLYESKKLLPLKNYIYSPLPQNQEVIYFTAIDKLDIIEKLYKDIMSLECSNKIGAMYYKDTNNEGYYYLEIFSEKASQKNAINELKKRVSADTIITFGNDVKDIDMIQLADYGYAVENAVDEVKEVSPNIIGSNDNDSVVKIIEKLFYSKTFYKKRKTRDS
ncbi:HAD-IIB family hydrolase [Inconstantimicrobium mannanitabidum]|uniref:Uncharacterized protein n=1 Tax=Inconstantimicrobium mannanitabidum TaxID=1604901 RepID=A0ACB5RHX4_9CLOT|nr:HAD-IIB family hydrolase [Clostridium sp. TW13]GKX68676.1 hypothetical protein rsdtw13_39340 [Clostridium sp. TW13]